MFAGGSFEFSDFSYQRLTNRRITHSPSYIIFKLLILWGGVIDLIQVNIVFAGDGGAARIVFGHYGDKPVIRRWDTQHVRSLS